ncbi:MAG TPA: hypothetical protein VGB52_14775 [Actinomycetota bacterium]
MTPTKGTTDAVAHDPQPMFVIARNPESESTLPYLLRLPLDGGLVLKARDTWPRANRIYCHPVGDWPDEAEIIEEIPVRVSRQRGASIWCWTGRVWRAPSSSSPKCEAVRRSSGRRRKPRAAPIRALASHAVAQ